MKKFAFLAASVLSVLATTAPVSAQTVYSDRAAFLAAVTGATTTTFNNVTNDIAVGSGNTVQGFTFSGSTQSQSLIDAPAFDYNPVNGIDGTTYLNLAGLATALRSTSDSDRQ